MKWDFSKLKFKYFPQLIKGLETLVYKSDSTFVIISPHHQPPHTFSGILAYSLRMGTSNTSRLSRCCSMEGRRCLRQKKTKLIRERNISTLLTCSRDQDLNPLAQSHQTLFNDVPLGLGEGSSTRQPVDGVQHGVDHYGPVVTAGKERRTFGDERQHSRAQVTVQSQGHLCGAEGNLRTRAEVPDV